MNENLHTFELARGYIDPQTGKAHRKVTIRAPLIDDEIKADAAVALAGAAGVVNVSAESASRALWELHFAAQCIISLGEIREVSVAKHLRSLPRKDAKTIVAEVSGFERRLEIKAIEAAKAEEADDPEGKGMGASPNAPSSSSGETPSGAS
jgi:hypothetical protein